MAARKVNSRKKRVSLRESLFPHMSGAIFPQPEEKGWVPLPRYMPSVFKLLSEPKLSNGMDLTRVLLGLWSDNYGEGVIEIANEEEYAEAAGFKGERGLRSWRDRVMRLEELGFLKVNSGSAQKVGHVLIVHPLHAIRLLRAKGLVPNGWWGDFHARVVSLGIDPTTLVTREFVLSLPNGETLTFEQNEEWDQLSDAPKEFMEMIAKQLRDLHVKAQHRLPFGDNEPWAEDTGNELEIEEDVKKKPAL